MKKNLLLIVFSIFLSFGIAEMVLRFVGIDRLKPNELPKTSWVNVPENVWIEHHPVLGWYSQKNKTATLSSPYFSSVEVHTNNEGFRGDKTISVMKPSDDIRILSLGDSFVFGFGVQDDETFSALLESPLIHREVLNAGVPGYGIDQIYLLYREIAKRFKPDIVLIGIFPEDFWRSTRSFADSGHVKPYFSLKYQGKLQLHNVPVPQPYSLRSDQFPVVLEKSFLQNLLNGSVLYRLSKRALTKLAVNMRLIDPDHTDEWILGRAILSQLIRDIRKDKATPVLVLIPPQNWVSSSRKPSFEKSLLRFAQRESVNLINLHPIFTDAVSKEGLETYYIKNDWHWTKEGHALAARAINEYFNGKK